MTASVERRPTTILAADVAGDSAAMERDEEGTLLRLRELRRTVQGFIERHRGRTVNTAGDGLLAEFPSVVEAVTAAVEMQRELGARERGAPPGRALKRRIGTDLGDVMVEGGDLFGEGVNVAARLQAQAEPGGILIAASVHDQVTGELEARFAPIGPQRLETMTTPVEAFRVLRPDETTAEDGRPAWLAHGPAERARPPADPASPGRAAGRWLLVLGAPALAALGLSLLPSLGWMVWPAIVLGLLAA